MNEKEIYDFAVKSLKKTMLKDFFQILKNLIIISLILYGCFVAMTDVDLIVFCLSASFFVIFLCKNIYDLSYSLFVFWKIKTYGLPASLRDNG
jgi:hypothetical protein